MTSNDIANQLVALCREGKNVAAVETLLSADAISVEARGDDVMPAVMSGRDAIRGKNEWWLNNHKVHKASVRGPFPNGDRFAVIYDFEVTALSGAAAGQRFRMEEVALYTVADGKIAREEFFYDMAGASNIPLARPARKKSARPAKRAVKAKARAKAKPKSRAKAGAATGKKARTVAKPARKSAGKRRAR